MNDENLTEIAEIGTIQFGVLSPEDIVRMSVCQIFNPKLNGPNSIYDERMGTMGKTPCVTCGMDMKECPGHFGHIELAIPILHPLYHKIIMIFLKCFCHKCFKLSLTKEQLEIDGLLRLKSESRIIKILDKISKIEICAHCLSPQPKIIYSIIEKEIYILQKHNREIQKLQMKVEDIKNIFDNITDDQVELLGISPKHTHPKNLIFTMFPVLPPRARPFIITDDGISDDDLTIQLNEITKTNQYLKNVELPEQKRLKYINILNFRIKSLMDNTNGKAKHTNGKAIKSIKERLSGKEGLLRSNLSGKRSDGTARTVIGPDPTLRVGQLAIPEDIAANLVFPEKVSVYNLDYLTKIVNDNKANFVIRGEKRLNLKYALQHKGTDVLYGDIIERNGKKIEVKNDEISLKNGDILYRNNIKIDIDLPRKKNFKLQIGDVVERQLRNGDMVLLNRQPTLHGASMLTHEIVIRPGKTFRFNLSTTSGFNADFDGDEMNIHTPSSYESLIELKLLSTPLSKFMNPQSASPFQKLVQDTLLSAYLMTEKDVVIEKKDFFNLCMKLVDVDGNPMPTDYILKKIKHIRSVTKSKGKPGKTYTGKGMFSMFLPLDFNLEKKNDGCKEEPIVKIYKGVLYEGTVTKSVLNSSILPLLYKEYNPKTAVQFINNIQFVCCEWLGYIGFSIGIADFIPNKKDEIKYTIAKGFIEAQGIENTTTHPLIKEIKVTAALSNARDVGMRIAKDAIKSDNNIVKTIVSGAKGDFPNLSQIIGLLGQQNIFGKRVEPVLNKGKRTLVYYPETFDDKKVEYESKGFISNSFIKGLNPKEFFFHAMSGREGTSNSALKTASTGYTQRRMIKVLEDVQIRSDSTVRDNSGQILQFSYGYDGFDGGEIIMKNNQSMATDISRLVDKLNMKYEKVKTKDIQK